MGKGLKLKEETGDSSSLKLKIVMETIQKRIEVMNRDIQEMSSDANDINGYFEYSERTRH